MPRLLVDYNRCLWYALMRVLELDIKGLANDLGVQRQTVHRWIEGRGRGPRHDSYLKPVFPILGVFRLKGQPKRDGSIIVRYCKATQSPVYPMRDAIAVVEHPSCPSSSSSCPLPVG